MKVNPIKTFFESKAVQKFYKKVCDPKHADFFNEKLPLIEIVFATACYVHATNKRKEIPPEQRRVLQYQNILGGVAGVAIGGYLNKKVTKFANELAPKIDKNIVDVHKVESGVKVLLPLAVVSCIMRLAVPVITAQMSTMIEDRNRAKKNKLDVKA